MHEWQERRRLWVCKAIAFFFSSRRRHTRSLRDWSSDVCSSDLILAGSRRYRLGSGPALGYVGRPLAGVELDHAKLGQPALHRSEERRVGKECRPGGSRAVQKKQGVAQPSHRIDRATTTRQARDARVAGTAAPVGVQGDCFFFFKQKTAYEIST